eukprot:639927-Pelagomonas_calceolata.AAC.3
MDIVTKTVSLEGAQWHCRGGSTSPAQQQTTCVLECSASEKGGRNSRLSFLPSLAVVHFNKWPFTSKT